MYRYYEYRARYDKNKPKVFHAKNIATGMHHVKWTCSTNTIDTIFYTVMPFSRFNQGVAKGKLPTMDIYLCIYYLCPNALVEWMHISWNLNYLYSHHAIYRAES